MPGDEIDDDVDVEEDVKKPASNTRGKGGKGGQAVAGPGLSPVYVSDTGLDRYSMKKGTRVTDIVEFKQIKKVDIMKDMEEMKDQCDFWSLKEQMEEYEGDTFLFIRGPENEFEYNYLWCSTVDSFEDHLQEMNEKNRDGNDQGLGDEDGGGDGDGDEDGEGGDKYSKRGRGKVDKLDDGAEKATVKRPVEILSDIEIATFQVKPHRPPLGFYISQSRFKFAKPVDFDDVEPGEKSAEYRRQKIPNYTEEKLVVEMGFQAAPKRTEIATQTFWLNSVNKATQYSSVNFHEEEKNAILNSSTLLDFLRAVEPITIRELQMNETLDIFKDEFREFEDEEVSLGNRLENNLEVFHSFHHYKYSKNKNINAVQWFPQLTPVQAALNKSLVTSMSNPSNGILVGFSCSNNVTFDQWVEMSGKVLTSSILIYTLQDVLHPWLVLEVPGNIQCFKVHPTHPEYVIAGLMTGQVLFWDLSDAREKVKQYQNQQLVNQHAYNRSGQNKANASGATTAAGASNAAPLNPEEHEQQADEIAIPPIKYTVLSYIDRSHSRPVSDLVWIPAHQQVNRKGELYAADKGISSQFASVAADGRILFWDFKNRMDGAASKQAAAAAAAAMGNGNNSLAMKSREEDPDAKEPKWAPMFSLPLTRQEGNNQNGPVGAVKLSVGEGPVMMAVTEDGEVVEVDWTARATEDRAKPDTVKSVQRAHFQASTTVERSPHFPDIYLTIGDWTFSIWKVGVPHPVFTSSCSSEYLSCGRWSPTRPGIIVTAKADGTIDVWDLVDQAHKASLNFQTGFADALSSLEFWQSKHSSQQYLAAGDTGGKLHIIEVPRNLRRKIANEENLMRLFYEREIARSKYSKRRAEIRKAQAAAAANQKNKTVSIAGPGDDPAAAATLAAAQAAAAAANAPAGSAAAQAAAAAAASGEKVTEQQLKEKAEKLKQLEEEKAEKDYQRMFEQFKATLAPEDMSETAVPSVSSKK